MINDLPSHLPSHLIIINIHELVCRWGYRLDLEEEMVKGMIFDLPSHHLPSHLISSFTISCLLTICWEIGWIVGRIMSWMVRWCLDDVMVRYDEKICDVYQMI